MTSNSEARKRAELDDQRDVVPSLYAGGFIRDFERDPHNDRVGEEAFIVWVKAPA